LRRRGCARAVPADLFGKLSPANPARPAGFFDGRRPGFSLLKDLPVTRHFRDDEEIARIARGVFDLSLPKPEWTHAAHFAAALWVLRHRPEPAEALLRAAIPAYNASTGVPNTDHSGYHETITLASVAAARALLKSHSTATPLHAVLDALMAGPLGRSDWLLAHWTKARLFSVEARRGWVGPDLTPLPFAVAIATAASS
jgi:hypothetical protein